VSQRIAIERTSRAGSWFGSGVVIISAAFLLLTINEGKSSGYQRYVDFVFHNWALMTGATAALWFTRRGRFGTLPRPLRELATVLLPFFIIFTFFAFLSSTLLWNLVKPLGLTRNEAAPVAILGSVALFALGSGWIFLRGLFRWLGDNYQHHGVGVGLGPVYVYFRKRRVP